MHKQIQKPNYQIHRNFENFFFKKLFFEKKKKLRKLCTCIKNNLKCTNRNYKLIKILRNIYLNQPKSMSKSKNR